MRYPGGGELPPDLEAVHRRAVRLEWITVAYLISAVTLLFFTLGSSQAMKGAWLEDMVSLAPPIAFLFAARVRYRAPSVTFAYGHHRSVEVAYLVSAVALLLMGTFLIFDSTLDLFSGEHPSIEMVELFGWQVWLGWLMLAALLYSAIPAFVLGRMKLSLASQLHDKVLHADARMNRADWLTAAAAMVGVVGIGLGLWWADAVAAIVIGADILRDGVRYTKAATADLLDGQPRRYDEKGTHPLVGEMRRAVAGLDWIEQGAVRIRELGHVFSADVLVVARPGTEDLPALTEAAVEHLRSLDWKVQDVVVSVVESIQNAPPGVLVEPDPAGEREPRPAPAS